MNRPGRPGAKHMDRPSPLADLLRDARSAVAFTGAGMSTESGIPDFRSPGGIWTRHRPVEYQEFLTSREARVRYWRLRVELWEQFADAPPNEGHRALAAMERRGLLRGVITQNIDGLHQAAGSSRVLEIHGTARAVGCLGCEAEYDPADVVARVKAGQEHPECTRCGAPLKSRTVSFGQMLPQDVLEEAQAWAQEADVFLAMGSSLTVEPAASLPALAVHAGSRLIIVNRDPTPLDAVAAAVVREPIGAALASAARALGLT